MTLSTTTSRIEYSGNGSTTAFSFPYYFLADGDLKVYQAGTLKTITTHYTVSGAGVLAGGTVTFVTAPASGEAVVIFRDPALTQSADYEENDPFPAETHEQALDRGMMVSQRLKDRMDRAAILADTDTSGADPTLPTPAALEYLRWNSGANALETVNLATSGNPTNADVITYNQGNASAVDRTVENKLQEFVSIKDFGAVCDGTTDDSAAIALAAASGSRTIDCRGMTIRVDSAISVLDNQTWLLEGAKFIFASSTQTVFDCDAVDDWALIGPFEIVGDGSTVGTAKGIRISDCTKFHVFCPTFKTIKGWGTYVEPGSSTTARGERGTITNPVYDSCYYGHYDLPGTGAEYLTVINVRATQCAVYGVRSAAGNVIWLGGHIVDNTLDGFYLTAGTNHAHGIVNGLNISHNGQYGVRCEDVTAGETFADCHLYENDIYIDECTDIVFDGGVMDVDVITNLEASGTAGVNYIRNMQFPGDYGPSSITNGSTRPVNLIFQNCYGAGAYISGLEINDPSPVYVQALRLAGSSQSFSSATPTTLVFNTEQSIGDRRNCYNNTTGVMTVPTGQTGLYRITVNLNFLGTSITADANYATVTAASTVRRIELSLFGTTLLSGTISFDQFLEAGNTVFVQGYVTATSPAFGSTTSASSLQIERIA